MDKRIKQVLLLAMLPCMSVPAVAGDDDFGLWLGAEVDKKLSDHWGLYAGGEFRNRANLKEVDRWTADVGAEYRINDYLRLSAGYELLYRHTAYKETYHDDDGTVNKMIPPYWSLRHRFNVSLTTGFTWGLFGFSLRERWQYTYRPEAKNKKYDTDTEEWGDVKGSGDHVLRSRLQVEYCIPRSKFRPYASVELYNGSGGIEKVRYSAGTKYKINKKNELKVYYLFQKHDDDSDGSVNNHVLGVSYEYKF
jgi:hypothetical protein